MYKNDPTVEQKYNLLVQTTGSDADAATVLQLLSSSVETASIPIYMDFFNKDPKNFATNFKALQTITNMQGKYGVTVDLKSTGTKEIEEVSVLALEKRIGLWNAIEEKIEARLELA